MHYLIIYWFIFWQKFIRNPFILCTSELATTYFPFFISMGRKWKPADSIYYKYPACIPFLSMWYPPAVLASKVTKYLSLDQSFRFFVYFLLGHYLLGSILAYKAFGLFGALTLMYAGYCIKPQTPAFVYTICWIPGFFINSPLQPLFLGLAILGGYWPILVYMSPLCLIFSPLNSIIGLFTAFPQIIPFIWYWKRSVRSGQKVDRNLGKLPWFKLKDLFWSSKSVGLVNGVHYPEAEMYMGIAPFFIWHLSWWWVPLILATMIAVGLIPPVQRISARTLYLISFSIVVLSASAIHSLGLNTQLVFLCLQLYLLLRNSDIYPSFPFSQWWNKPSKIYPKSDYTGYLENKKIHDYKGGFCLKEAA